MEHEIPEEIREFIEGLGKDKEEKEPAPVTEREFVGQIKNDKKQHQSDFLKAQLGVLGCDAVLDELEEHKRLGDIPKYFKEEVEMINERGKIEIGYQYYVTFTPRGEMGFKTDERKKQ